MLEAVKDISLLIVSAESGELSVLRTAAGAANIKDTRIETQPARLFDIHYPDKPDCVIVPLDWKPELKLQLIRRLRRDAESFNRFVAIVGAMHRPTLAQVKTVLGAGAHEFFALPGSTTNLMNALYRAVFISRPFIETEAYVGPCRRRKANPKWSGPERRLAPWPGYIHPAHQHETDTGLSDGSDSGSSTVMV